MSTYTLRDYNNPVKVVFIQGLQGSGKSTIGKYCCEYVEDSIYIEQDMYNGDSNACQQALYNHIVDANGPKVIFITRCNINTTHCRRYLDICYKLPTIILFFSPKVFNPLYLMISLAGILNRSQNTDNLIVGNFEVPINDVISFTKGNYDIYEKHPKAINYEIHKNDPTLLDSAKLVYKKGVSAIVNFVKTHRARLMELRLPIEEVCKPILDSISTISTISLLNVVVPTNPIYIAAAIYENDRNFLLEFVDKYVPENPEFTTYLHHMTQRYIGGKFPKELDFTPFMPGEQVQRHICALVIRKSDKACAFRISPLPGDGPNFHITAKLPNGTKAMVSNSFVGLNNDSVTVVEIDYPIEMIGFWKI